MAVLAIADKKTLDEVNGKCDEILAKIHSGGGVDLDSIGVLVLDIVNDEITYFHGAGDAARRRITT